MDKKNLKPNASDSSSFTTSKSNKSSSAAAAAAAAAAMTVVSRNVTEPRPVRRMLQSFLLVWLDADFDESKDHYNKSIQDLQRIVATITTFTDADQCVDFLSDIEDEKVFMIVSDALGQHIVPEIQALPQLHSIYVFCDNQSIHQQWTKTIPKVKGVYTQIEPICEALQIDQRNCDQNMISISFDRIDPLFMYTQLLKEALLEIEDDDTKSIKELVEYCRLHSDAAEKTLKMIEKEYRNHTPIWWYTGPYFIYSMLNHGLRLMDIDVILKLGFFIRHLHQHITKLHREQQQSSKAAMPSKFQVFRGQGLSMEAFEKMKKTKGGLMSFNSFLSTSRNREISLESFARLAALDANSVGILFVMNIDTAICTSSLTPFVSVKDIGFYDDQEEEILFSTHTIFRIDRIEPIEDKHTDRLWQVNLTLAGNQDDDFNKLTAHLSKQIAGTTGWSRFSDILINVGKFEKAKHLYELLLENASSDEERSEYYFQLARVYKDMGENSKALTYYEKNLEFKQKILPPNHPNFATTYNQIGLVYYNMGEYSKALSSHERSLEIRKIAFPPNHTDLATSYNNIGMVYNNMGEYLKALSSHEQSLQIQKIALPPNHPSLAASHNNIGMGYRNMGEYSKALSSYEQSLEIKKIALPPNHPGLASSYNNIGMVYDEMAEYSKALSSYERSLEIRKIALPRNHPDLAASYNNIGVVYNKMGEYSKAFSSHEGSLEIRKIALPPNHPDLATSYNNIGMVYNNMGEYSKALSSHERSLEIKKIALPPNHTSLATSYNNIGLMYYNMGEYSKALSSYERSLEIKKIAFSPNHISLANSYNNIGLVYYNMGEYSKALSSYERSLEIKKIALSPNHPDLASSYNNIGIVYRNMGEYSKALSSYERSLEIQKIAFLPNHPDLAKSYNNIGFVYDNMGEYSKALSYYEKALQIKKIALRPGHPSTALTERNIESGKKKMQLFFF
ncbi:unnamed protein product [Rotaria sordida]|uniref:UDP-N-acetylglucosamine--peptide N-acetylglucosaminyltransferase SPINDLY n=1 Tax=Rotaria sordida TaxID=392033 RepID=A0A819N6U4_9BILA|nr:unnamed protein product [Rotaria sordida]